MACRHPGRTEMGGTSSSRSHFSDVGEEQKQAENPLLFFAHVAFSITGNLEQTNKKPLPGATR